ncbi:MAG: hypothetical protein ACP5HD_01810 [Thermoproteus sp.]
MELADPLIAKYNDLLRRKGLYDMLDMVAPDGAVLNLIASMAGSSAAEALDRLSRLVEGRLDRRTAAEAYAEIAGVYDEELAVKSLARHIANWYLRLAEELGLITLKPQ